MNKKIIQNAHYTTGKKLLFITLIFLFSLASSITTSAITYNVQLKNQQYVGTLNGGACYYEQGGQYFSIPIDTRGFCGIPQNTSVSQPLGLKYALSPTYSVNSNNYYQIGVTIIGEQGYNAISWAPTAPYNFNLIDFVLDYNTSTKDYCDNYKFYYTGTSLTTFLCDEPTYARRVVHYTMLIKPNNDGTSSLGFGNMNDLRRSTFFMNSPVGITGFYFDDIYSFELAGNDLDKAEQETQQATDEGNQNAEQATTDNEQASTNLVGVVTKVVNAFNTPPSSSCSIPIVASGVDLGNVDFCTGKPPFWTQLVGGVGSLILVYACYRVAINMFNLFISLTVFAQGGKSKGDNG